MNTVGMSRRRARRPIQKLLRMILFLFQKLVMIFSMVVDFLSQCHTTLPDQPIHLREQDGKAEDHVPCIMMTQGVNDHPGYIREQLKRVYEDIPAVIAEVSSHIDTQRIQPHDGIQEQPFPEDRCPGYQELF